MGYQINLANEAELLPLPLHFSFFLFPANVANVRGNILYAKSHDVIL